MKNAQGVELMKGKFALITAQKILNNSSAKNMDNHYGGDMWSGPSSSHSPSGVYPVPSLPS